MPSSREVLDDLFLNKAIDLCRGTIFDQPPTAPSPGFDFDKVEGMMLGLAIGDSLGVTTEGVLPHDRLANFGVIRDYIPDVPIGFPSDDTQMASPKKAT